MPTLQKAQGVAARLYVWRFALVFLGFYTLGFGGYYLLQGPSVFYEVALLLCVTLFGWVLLAWLIVVLFLHLPLWQQPESRWQKLKQGLHKFWYQLLLWTCVLLSIATLYLMAKALKALLSQLL
jgi:hypothetical protein